MRAAVLAALLACAGGLACADDAGGGGGDGGGSSPDGASAPGGTVRYPVDRTQSPLTETMAAALRARAIAGPREDVFAKVGDSITVSTLFLGCLAGPSTSLPAALEPSRAALAAIDVGGTTSFERESLAAGVGWSAPMALAGTPSPLDQELDAITPRLAVVMYGTNDVESGDLDRYHGAMADLVDRALAGGTIPILSSIPPRMWNANDARVPAYNLIVRALAQGRGLPLVDFHREAAPLPGYGLGPDGLHPDGIGGGCDFGVEGLAHGQNVRNLITLTALDRVRRVLAGEPAPDAEADAPRLDGDGSAARPFVATLPFVDQRDGATGPGRALDGYACAPGAPEGGPETIYEVVLDAPARLVATVVDRGDVDVDVHVLAGALDPAACVVRDDRTAVADLPAGTHYVVVDTYVAGGVERAGEYALTLHAE